MIIFRFRVFFTFTGCIEVCNEGIKCFIAALLLLLAIHNRLSKRIGIGIVLLEYYGTGTFFDGIVCLNIMHGVFILPEQPNAPRQARAQQKQCQIAIVFFLCLLRIIW